MKFNPAFKMSILAFLLLFSGMMIIPTTHSTSATKKLVILYEQTFGGSNVDYNYALINCSDSGYIMAGHTSSFGAGSIDAWVVKVDMAGNHQWNYTMGGTGEEVVFNIIPTLDDGYALTGLTESFGSGDWDVWLIKIDNTGQIQWNQTYGGAEKDYGGDLVLTPEGEYVIFGYTESFGLGARDFYLIKTDASGNMLWNKTYGGFNSERGSSIILTEDGGFLLIGVTETSTYGSQDIWIVKTDSNGNHLWNRTFGGPNIDAPFGVIPSLDDGFIITGRTDSYGAGGADAWLIKIDQDGFHEWNRTYGGSSLDYTTTIIPSNDNGYILAGRTASYGEGGEDMWLIKTNSFGEIIFDQTFGGTNADAAYGVVENGEDGFSLAGRTSSFGEGADDIWFIITVFEDITTDNFTFNIVLSALTMFILIRIRFSYLDKKRKKDTLTSS